MNKNKSHVTYLLGAGASYPTLPLVKDFSKKVDDFIKKIESKSYREINGLKQCSDNKLLKKIKTDFEYLSQESSSDRHFSVDTFAKKLFLQNQKTSIDKLESLKFALQLYLVLEQLENNTHIRYDSFFASTLNAEIRNGNREISVPKNISILTWNYDFQIERSLINEFQISDYSNSFSFFPNNQLNLTDYYDEKKMNIIKLNGTSGIFLKDDDKSLVSIYDLKENSNIDKVIAEVIKGFYNGRSFKSMIDFAWENENPYTQASRKLALEVAKRTEYLIVIGYSFPYFNREIDSLLLEEMIKTGKLKGIYLQVGKDADSVTTRINSINKQIANKIKVVSDLEQFYLPDELEQEYLPPFIPNVM